MRLNLEIAGIAAFVVAALMGIALVAPSHSGALGAATAHGLLAAFGRAAWLSPVLVALIGGIVFLEIDVPRTIATLGFASFCYFAIVDAFFARDGGAFGRILHRGLEVLVGPAGATLVLAFFALAVTVWIANLSVKRVLGFGVLAVGRVRATIAGAIATARARAAASAKRHAIAEAGTLALADAPGPKTWREAFHLPPRESRPNVATGSAAARDGLVVAAPAPPTPAGAVAAPVVTLAPIAPTDVRRFIADENARGTVVDPGDEEYVVVDEYDGEFDDDVDGDVDDRIVATPSGAAISGGAAAVARGATGAATAGVAASGASAAIVGEYEPRTLAGDPLQRKYALPNLDLFDPPQAQIVDDSTRSQLLEETLASFGVGAKVTHVQRGPSITRYELRPEKGVKISRITALADDLALALAATSVRIEAPIPGKSAVGIEVPNAQTSIVAIREILDALPQRGTVPPLHMALGKDITGRPVFGDLGKMPHLLVAGATGSGKSVCLNTIIASLLVSATPDQVQMLFIDPKRVELTVYNGIPHLIKEVITDARLAAGALFEMTKEMDSRYERFQKASVRKIEEYNAKYPDEKLPYVVIVIDELADLMLIAPAKVETTICRLAQLARATGIHLVVATQRPSVDVITGIIKANIPSRIAFAVSSQVDSRTILDMVGAERLLGRGDMLFLPIDAPKPVRSQGAYITGPEVSRLVEFWATQAAPENLLDVEVVPIEEDDKKREVDPLCYEAARFIIESDFASTAQLQQRFSIGHPRAVRVMKQLEEFGVVGPHEGTKPRRINIGIGELETIADRLGRDEQMGLDLSAT